MQKSRFPGDPVLSKTADYALRALLVLARSDRAVTADEIAGLTGAPANYLGKTLGTMARAGLVRAARGRTGGFSLAATADSITVARIAQVFSEPREHRQCLLGTGRCNAADPCGAHHRWKRLMAAVSEPLEATTIADLLGIGTPPISFDLHDDREAGDPTRGT